MRDRTRFSGCSAWLPACPALTALLVPVALSCGGDDSPGPAERSPSESHSAPAGADSAGIRVVENDGPLWREGDGWSVASEPRVTVGRREGGAEHFLYRVRGATVLSSGEIVVADDGEKWIRYFDPEGRWIRTVGGSGGGPGEFGEVGYFLGRLPGDSLVVYDIGRRDLVVFGPEGEYVRQRRIPLLDNYHPEGTGAGGQILLLRPARHRIGGPPGIRWDSTAAVVTTVNLERVDTVGWYPNREVRVGADGRTAPYFLGPRAALVTDGEHLYAGRSDRYEIRVVRPDGTLARIVRKAHDFVEVDAGIREAFGRAYLENFRGSPEFDGGRTSRMLREAPYGEVVPAFWRFFLDPDGYLWVEQYDFPGAPVPGFDVFAPNGRWLGPVEAPPGVTGVFEIGRDHLLAKREDELGVEYVDLYELER